MKLFQFATFKILQSGVCILYSILFGFERFYSILDVVRNEKHIRRKRGLWRSMWRGIGNFFTGIVHTTTCVITFFSCLWGGRAGPVGRTMFLNIMSNVKYSGVFYFSYI